VKTPLLLVTHGLISNQDGLTLHPDLFLWQESLVKRKKQWFYTDSYNPLALYAKILDVEPALLLASKLSKNTAKQCWIASPYHAQLTRDAVRVMPEEMLPWCEEDAIWACELLNPLLSEEGMRLEAVGAALLLLCDKPLDASPCDFSEISGGFLPNRHPTGADGGDLMRLMAEIQMIFKQSPALHRRNRGEMDVHGLWLWNGCEASQNVAVDVRAVASKNAFLNSIVDGKDASVIITEPESLSALVRQGADLPKRVVLWGEGHAVLLKSSLFPTFGAKKWTPKTIKSESDLFSILRT